MPGKRDSEIFDILRSMNSNIMAVKDSVAALDKKVDLHTQKTEFEFRAIRELDDKQNRLLAEHHDRSNQLKKDNELREEQLRKDMLTADSALATRIESLEVPKKWLASTWAIVLYVSVAVGVIMKLLKFFQIFEG